MAKTYHLVLFLTHQESFPFWWCWNCLRCPPAMCCRWTSPACVVFLLMTDFPKYKMTHTFSQLKCIHTLYTYQKRCTLELLLATITRLFLCVGCFEQRIIKHLPCLYHSPQSRSPPPHWQSCWHLRRSVTSHELQGWKELWSTWPSYKHPHTHFNIHTSLLF